MLVFLVLTVLGWAAIYGGHVVDGLPGIGLGFVGVVLLWCAVLAAVKRTKKGL